MAAGTIITVLSNIPWGQVVEAAPKVADGAAKLWDAVTRKKPDQEAQVTAAAFADAAQSEAEIFKKRVAVLEEHVVSLQEQMGASTGLIKALAEQNAQLVAKIELNSARLFRLVTGTAIGAVLLVGAMSYLALRQ